MFPSLDNKIKWLIIICHTWNMRKVLVYWRAKWNLFYCFTTFMARKHDLREKKSVCHANFCHAYSLNLKLKDVECWDFWCPTWCPANSEVWISSSLGQPPKRGCLKFCCLGLKDRFLWHENDFIVFRRHYLGK
jgi:hypothetical protein